jgi:hypothetical protein
MNRKSYVSLLCTMIMKGTHNLPSVSQLETTERNSIRTGIGLYLTFRGGSHVCWQRSGIVLGLDESQI